MRIGKTVAECHEYAKSQGFWDKSQNIGEKLMLIVSELAEALEADRQDDQALFNEELADVAIRLFDLCGFLHVDLEMEITRKMAINRERPKLHGKRY